jgi:O-methyltransferase
VITTGPNEAADRYIRLLKHVLNRQIDPVHYREIPKNTKTPWKATRWAVYNALNKLARLGGFALVQKGLQARAGETMLDQVALDHLDSCVRTVVREEIPGDFIETGVWRGGACILMRALLAVTGDTTRRVWVADSFEGLPKPNASLYPADSGDTLWTDTLGVSVDAVKRNFEKYGLLDDRVIFLKGWFKDTLPTAPIERLAIMRLDGDLYESTIQALEALYPKLSVGGFCLIDDYGAIPACAKAVHDYRDAHGITEPVERIQPGPGPAFWRRLR